VGVCGQDFGGDSAAGVSSCLPFVATCWTHCTTDLEVLTGLLGLGISSGVTFPDGSSSVLETGLSLLEMSPRKGDRG
jgi:hypothetical protein